MPELNTTSPDYDQVSWLPSFDLHEKNGELVLHAHLRGYDHVEISLDGGDLILRAEGESRGCFHLPFAPHTLRAVRRSGHEDLEVRISMPPVAERA